VSQLYWHGGTRVIHVHDRHSAGKGRTIMTTFTINEQNEIVATVWRTEGGGGLFR
jgi:hypothetical protein